MDPTTNTALTFLGELELSGDQLQNPAFADFDRLPHVDLVRSLAGEFASAIELMPYQKDGDIMRLLVSVYLQPKHSSGRVIGVLTRGPYPQTIAGLFQLVTSAEQRLLALETIADRFEEGSIPSARQSLQQLAAKIRDRI